MGRLNFEIGALFRSKFRQMAGLKKLSRATDQRNVSLMLKTHDGSGPVQETPASGTSVARVRCEAIFNGSGK
jgi:hypothetical protein